MKYQQGTIGRVFIVKLEHGDDILKELKNLAVQENIKVAGLYMIGALRKADLVAGPRDCTLPPEPVWKSFADGREIVGLGTILSDGAEPAVHLHGTLGKGDISLTGCVRAGTEVHMVVEVIIMEFNGINAVREFDVSLGSKILHLK